MEELLRHHIKETERRFDEVREDLVSISEKLDSLTQFKIETIISSRWVSLIVSAGCGFLTLAASSFVTYLIGKN